MSDETLNTRIISSMEKLWRRILAIREFTTQFIFFQSTLLPEEYDNVVSGKAKQMVPRLSREEFDEETNNLVSKIESVRPFVGERLWSLYSVYVAFSVRQAMKVQDGLEKKKLQIWDKDFQGQPDSYMQQMLSTVFTEQELSQLHVDGVPGAAARIIQALEVKILNEMNDWIFNRRLHKA